MKLGKSLTLACLATLAGLSQMTDVQAQVRTKRPDRGTYQPPMLEPVVVEPIVIAPRASVTGSSEAGSSEGTRLELNTGGLDTGGLRQVANEEILLVPPQASVVDSMPRIIHDGSVIHDEGSQVIGQPYIGETWEGESWDGTVGQGGGCDAFGCDSMGCDSGCGGAGGSGWLRGWTDASIPLSRDQWFGGLDLMLMFRNGDRLPPLVTTGPAGPNAGAIGGAGTQILSGDDTVYKDPTVGGRLTLGTWLDDCQSRSLVFRGWSALEENFGFNATGDDIAVLARPFNNVDGTTVTPTTVVIASPGVASGSVHVSGSSDVFGGDVSVRQLWYGGYGGTVDLLYGYQYMRLDENLRISSESLSIDGSLGPAGSIISIRDSFDAENEFHGGQLGIASRYREGCWSFRSLAKVGFGSLRRSARRSGSTTTQNVGSFTDPQGLLVRDTNRGTINDSTFGWVPELDLSIGWHYLPRLDVTLGYHIIGMTDALQVSGAMDPNLQSNLTSPLVGNPVPAPRLRFDTFYVQGIHLGLQYVY